MKLQPEVLLSGSVPAGVDWITEGGTKCSWNSLIRINRLKTFSYLLRLSWLQLKTLLECLQSPWITDQRRCGTSETASTDWSDGNQATTSSPREVIDPRWAATSTEQNVCHFHPFFSSQRNTTDKRDHLQAGTGVIQRRLCAPFFYPCALYQKQLLCCSVPMLIHPLVWCSAPLTRRSSPALTLLCTPTHTFVYISAEAFSRCVWQHNQCVSLKVWPKFFVMSEGHRWCWNRLCNMMRRISQTQSPERDSFLPGHMDQH